MSMTIGDLKKSLEHFSDDKKVFMHDGSAVECFAALRMSGDHPDSVMLISFEQFEQLKSKSGQDTSDN